MEDIGGGVNGVKEVGGKYRCNICGNEVIVTKVGGDFLICCGQETELIGSTEIVSSLKTPRCIVLKE